MIDLQDLRLVTLNRVGPMTIRLNPYYDIYIYTSQTSWLPVCTAMYRCVLVSLAYGIIQSTHTHTVRVSGVWKLPSHEWASPDRPSSYLTCTCMYTLVYMWSSWLHAIYRRIISLWRRNTWIPNVWFRSVYFDVNTFLICFRCSRWEGNDIPRVW